MAAAAANVFTSAALLIPKAWRKPGTSVPRMSGSRTVLMT
jgi:hypothetical protein